MITKPILPLFLPAMSIARAQEEINACLEQFLRDNPEISEGLHKNGDDLDCNNPNCGDKEDCAKGIAIASYLGLMLATFDIPDSDVQTIIDRASMYYGAYMEKLNGIT